MQFFPIFLLGALFGKLMEDSGSVSAIASFMTERLGAKRAVLAVVLAGALVTYGGVSLFVAFFVLAPMAHALFRSAGDPAATDAGGDRARHHPLSRCRRFRERPRFRTPSRCRSSAPRRSRRRASASSPRPSCWGSVCGGSRAPRPSARSNGEGYGRTRPCGNAFRRHAAEDQIVRERATTSSAFDPAEIAHGDQSAAAPPIALAVLPLIVVIGVNLLMSLIRIASPRRLVSR